MLVYRAVRVRRFMYRRVVTTVECEKYYVFIAEFFIGVHSKSTCNNAQDDE